MKQTHLIERYDATNRTILCCCGWLDNENEFKLHQDTSPPTSAPAPEILFEKDFSSWDTTPSRLRLKKSPDWFDYVNSEEIFPSALLQKI